MATADKVDPIHQFHINDIMPLGEIAGMPIALTNSGLFMLIITLSVTLFLTLSTRGRTLVPGRAQLLAEMTYEFVANMVRGTAGTEGMRFFPLVFSLFMFVLFANLIGMVPYFFTVTSHVSVTFSLAMLVMVVVVGFGIKTHGLKFFNLFLPSGIPAPLVPLIVLIEIISFISRPLSLSMRLFGNMLGGHIAMKVIASFIVGLASINFLGVIGASLPLFLLVALTALEFLVAFLQAYVFAVLTCVYLNDALHPSH